MDTQKNRLDGTSLIIRMTVLRKKRVDILRELNKRGITCQAPHLSNALNGNYPYLTEKVHEILTNTERILTEWEQEASTKTGA